MDLGKKSGSTLCILSSERTVASYDSSEKNKDRKASFWVEKHFSELEFSH